MATQTETKPKQTQRTKTETGVQLYPSKKPTTCPYCTQLILYHDPIYRKRFGYDVLHEWCAAALAGLSKEHTHAY